jgi:hypothetical protein
MTFRAKASQSVPFCSRPWREVVALGTSFTNDIFAVAVELKAGGAFAIGEGMNAHTRHSQNCDHLSVRRWHRASIVATVLGALMLGVPPGFNGVFQADAAIAGWCATGLRPADAWNTLTVDMIVKRQRLTSAGGAVGAPTPNATYRLERSSRTGSWKTVVTVLSVARPPSYSFSGALTSPQPFPVARIEDDENGSPLRAYGANGALLTPTLFGNTVATSTIARSTGQQWLDAFVATPGKKTSRQLAFERAYGKATKAGPLHKYVRLETNGSEELLVDPKLVIPVEANTTRGGKRLGHRTFVYGAAPDSALVRTNVHADTVTSADTGDRSIVDTAFSNVCLEVRR